MQHSERENNLFHRLAGKAGLLGGVLMAFLIAGCGGSTTKQTSTTTSTPQTYFAPYVAGTTYYYGTSASLETPLTYTMDDTAGAGTFSQTAYGLPSVPGSQVLNAGVLSVGQSGLRNLSMETYYVSNNNVNAAYIAETYIPFQPAGSDGRVGAVAWAAGSAVGGRHAMSKLYYVANISIPHHPVASTNCGHCRRWDIVGSNRRDGLWKRGHQFQRQHGYPQEYQPVHSAFGGRNGDFWFLFRDRGLRVDFLWLHNRRARTVGHYRSWKRPNRTRASEDRNRR